MSYEIQHALDCCIEEMCSKERLLPLMLAKVARLRNLDIPEEDIQSLASSLLQAEGDVIHLDLDAPCSLGETEEQVQSVIERLVDDLNQVDVDVDLTNALSIAIPKILKEVAELIGGHLSEQMLEHTTELRKIHSDRVDRVRSMWGETIDKLDFLRHIVVEWNSTAMKHREGVYSNQNTAFVLSRLVTRVYDVVGEIVVLIRSGFADGALARWRSLHELCVIAMFIGRCSGRCAAMYLEHCCIDELKLLETDKCSRTSKSINNKYDHYIRNLRAQRKRLVKKYGPFFVSDYGWASVELGGIKPTFRDIENYVELDILRSGYRQANSTVHGGALATLTRISLGSGGIDSAEMPPAYGCEVALSYTASSLSMLVAELCLEICNSDMVTIS